jgi:transposase
VRLRSDTIKGRGKQPWPEISDPDLALSVQVGRAAIDTLTVHIERLEKLILKRVDPAPQFRMLKTVTGIGPILAMTIALEVGDIGRFAGVGEFASYCRCVDSQRLSNGKKKGEANRKCGNRYLAWAFMEAAHFAIRVLPAAKRFYERKRRQRHAMLAVKALAHKLARACFYILRDQVPFAPERLFA